MTWRRGLAFAALGLFIVGGIFVRTVTGWVVDGLVWVGHRSVPTISTDALAEAMGGPRPLLIDVRPLEEYAVSHLPGARRVDPEAPASALADVAVSRPIVTYCSVGWRSAAFAERLIEAGYRDVHNLRGSLFRWAREDRPLAGFTGPTTKVHPYTWTWGLLIDDDRHALAP